MAIISTIEAKCRDCYKCVRACPVKAIRIRGGAASAPGVGGAGSGSSGRLLHAEVVEERCILDGECLRVCPQKAKKVRPDTDRVRAWLRSGEQVVVSLAPSFAAAFAVEVPLRVVGALKGLGFAAVSATAAGASLVAAAVREEVEALTSVSGRQPRRTSDGPCLPVIATSCPVVVNLMETVYPPALRHASRIVSPMVAHGRLLKAAYPGAKIVFVGPCVAKKAEAERAEVSDAVDAVLTFGEISDWLLEEGRKLEQAEASDLDGGHPTVAGLFPIEGGLLRTASLPTDITSSEWLVVSGMDACREILSSLTDELPPVELENVRLIEMLACRGGCTAGPAVPAEDVAPLVRRQRLLSFANSVSAVAPTGKSLHRNALSRTFSDRRPAAEIPSEAVIKGILARVGKRGPEDELNCGVCGYSSCREKAIAVHRGMAELDMCLPYMREIAESISNSVVASIPNGVVAVDHELRITYVNEAFRRLFSVPDETHLVGQPLNTLLDDSHFRATLSDHRLLQVEVAYPERHLLTRQTIFYLEARGSTVGVFIDLTADAKQREQLEQLRGETIDRAREVISKQMKVAQEIAGLLGETTAETKVILTRLIDFINKEGAANGV